MKVSIVYSKGSDTVSYLSSRVWNKVKTTSTLKLPKRKKKSDVIIFVSSNACDLLTTWIGLSIGGSEGNPFLVSIGINNIFEIASFKIVFVAIFCYLFRNHTSPLKISGIFFTAVCVWNTFLILTLSQ